MVSSPSLGSGKRTPRRVAYVLDDEAQIGAFVCEILVANGFAARQYADALPFLAEVEADAPLLAIVDLALGHSDAVEVIRQLKAIKYRGRVLLMSGRDEGTLAQINQIGERHGLAMLSPLKKPFRAGDLKLRLADLIASDQPLTAEEHPTAVGTQDLPAGASRGKAKVDIEEALQRNWLELWYQPKIDLKSLLICGGEALLRARHPKLGVVAPADLLPPAGDPRYQPLSWFVIRRAVEDWELFARQGTPIQLSVNVPVSVVLVPDFIGFVRGALPSDPRFPGLIVEITEDEIIEDREWVHEVATQLKLYDVSISIDDFGSAYSSLSRLNDLPFSELKLDRSFVSGCSSNPLKFGVCRTVVDLARNLGASVCAEGVEEREDLRSLVEIGCDTAQGFLFARPMPAEQFAQMLQRGEPVLPLEQSAQPTDGKPTLVRRARVSQRRK
jgi:EAL domain-containing protein (putative c-di-GMP-specific phosphodiesterase class I)/ActR/RegA family two-component response regulator